MTKILLVVGFLATLLGVCFGDCQLNGGLLAGKVVLITGATSGIGRVTAIEAAAQGAKVVVAGRREAKGQIVVDEIKAAGGEAFFVQADVTQEESVKNMVDKVVEVYGRLDGAFNNAGYGLFSPVEQFDVQVFDEMFATNVKGVMLCTKYEAEAMKKNGAEGGSIVNHASISAISAMPSSSIYGASKAAVYHFTNVVAAELGPLNIRANTMNTGLIPDTEIFDPITGGSAEVKDGLVQSLVSRIPMARPGQPKEIADPVIFLLSDMASYVTGSQITADGGYVL